MDQLILYCDFISQPSRAVEIFLRCNRIPHEIRFINLLEGEQNEGDFRKMNPFGKVPVIVHKGIVVIESGAILQYLCRAYNTVPEHWYPKRDVKTCTVIDQYLAWHHLNTRAKCYSYVREKLKSQILGDKKKENKERLVKLEKSMLVALKELQEVWLKDRKFLAGDKISIADLIASTELDQFLLIGYDIWAGYPRIKQWILRVRQSTEPHYMDVLKAAKSGYENWMRKFSLILPASKL